MTDTVLLEVTCACGSSHDVFGEETTPGRFQVAGADLRCPACEHTRPANILPRESLA